MSPHYRRALLGLGLFSTAALAEPPAPLPVVVTETAGLSFADVRTALENAIANHGLKIIDTLHIGDMLHRTAADTGLTPPYAEAEALEFCSISLLHKMAAADPANLATCPLTVSYYTLPSAPQKVFMAYRRPALIGDADAAAAAVVELLDGIVKEAADF